MSNTAAAILYFVSALFLALSWVFSHPRSGLGNWALPAGLTSLAALLFVLAWHFESA